jgi:hypothetical protein
MTGSLPPINSSWAPRPEIFLQTNTCSHSPYISSSLTRGWLCSLQLLLALASVVILRSYSRGTRDHILLSQIWDSLNLEGQVPVFISSRNRLTQLYPQALDSLWTPPTSSKSLEQLISFIISRHRLLRKHRFQKFLDCCGWTHCRGNLFVSWALPSNGSTRYMLQIYPRIDNKCNTRSSIGFKILLNILLMNFKEFWLNIHIK